MTNPKKKQVMQHSIVKRSAGIKLLHELRHFCETHPKLINFAIFLCLLVFAFTLAWLLIPIAGLSKPGSTSDKVTGPYEPLKIDKPIASWPILGVAATELPRERSITEHQLTSTDATIFSSHHHHSSRCPSVIPVTPKLTSSALKEQTYIVPATASLILEKGTLSDTAYKKKYKKIIDSHKNTIAARIMTCLEKYPERDYLRLVFSQESLLIVAVIQALPKVEQIGFLGKYAGAENTLMIVNPHTIPAPDFDRIILHESWHAYVSLVRHKGSFPPHEKTLEAYQQLSAPFKNKEDQVLYKEAIDNADSRIDEFSDLLNLAKLNLLTLEQQSQLTFYIKALDDWQPLKYHHIYQATDEEDMKNKLELYGQGTKNITPQGNIPYRLFADDKKQNLIYYTSVKPIGPLSIMISGDFAMPRAPSEYHLFKAEAFIAREKFLRSFLNDAAKKVNKSESLINYLTERDTHAIELSEKMQSTFYRELRSVRQQLGYCDFTEFEIPELSAERALVI